ncbi:MAG: pentapeptide repeat-containing protein [Cyanobacteria bacterium P01_G01_bin.67]
MNNQSNSLSQPLGQILIEAGLISINQIEIALREQEERELRIGEILVAHGWIKQETVDFFAEQWRSLITESKKQPLVYYFQQASLLDTEQIKAILRLQKLKHQKVRFHHLAVEQGYLKQKTVDFFLAYLFKIHDPKSISIAKPYEVLKKYSKGVVNFSKIDLQKAPMMGVSLREVILDGSNLSSIDLSKANLSQSSLIRVNLISANLSQVILSEANLSNSFLTQANLYEAHLEKANFRAAILQEVNLQASYLSQANFAGADLSKAKLPLDYPYDVYYDQDTIFDHDFDPKLRGWTQIKQGSE